MTHEVQRGTSEGVAQARAWCKRGTRTQARYRYGERGVDSMHEGNRALAGRSRDRQAQPRTDGGTWQGTVRMQDEGATWMRAGMDRRGMCVVSACPCVLMRCRRRQVRVHSGKYVCCRVAWKQTFTSRMVRTHCMLRECGHVRR